MKTLPYLPIRELVFLPEIISPLIVGRTFSKKAVDYAIKHKEGNMIFSTQKNAFDEVITDIKNVQNVGVIAKIIQIISSTDDTYNVLVECKGRVKLNELEYKNHMFHAKYEDFPVENDISEEEEKKFTEYLKSIVKELNIVSSNRLPYEVITSLFELKPFSMIMYTVASNFDLSMEQRIKILKLNKLSAVFKELCLSIKSKIEFEMIDREVENKVRKNIDESQRQYYIRQKIKGLYSELEEENLGDEFEELANRIEKADLPYKLEDKIYKEFYRLKKLNDYSPESSVIRTYIEKILEVPWCEAENLPVNINRAELILNEEHFGLEKIKDVVLEFIAVNELKREDDKKMSSILCLIGPPGVGKTSLGESVAKAMRRKFERISLGGISDEAEIRGHRRTYVGAMPGKIIDALIRSKVPNPVILLDEIDKLSNNFKGDPAAALLEVLDPAQNKSFKDNYIDYEVDLSNAFFICTANDYSNIPKPLLDRMEIVFIDSYTENEKLNIAKNYLLKQARLETGIKSVKISDDVLLQIIRKYTREAGVRNLKREIVKIFRKIARIKLQKPSKRITVNVNNLIEYLGVEKFKDDKMANNTSKIGIVKGLAWTSVGGTTLDVEIVKMQGKGLIQFTGKLGDVMKESAQVAYSYVRANAEKLSIKNLDFYTKEDLHIHFPEGATPKDGPSAGITITTAIVSILSDRKVKQNIAMTGEITISGDVLPVGGIKEKILGAVRVGIHEVIIPFDNMNDTIELPEEIANSIKIHFVKTYKDVEKIIFEG